MKTHLPWAPTIAMSWLWGLGFFYSIHVTLAYGPAGFAAFALPNAAGLWLFGHVLGRHPDPEALLASASARYGAFMLAYQVLAVAICLHGFSTYLVAPMLGTGLSVPASLALALGACAIGQSLSLDGLRRLHVLTLAAGLACALAALAAIGASSAGPAPRGLDALDGRLLGLAVPSLAGFLLGPWLDVQQWQRAIAVRRSGGDPGRAYAWGALLFLGLISLNAAIALAGGVPTGVAGADGVTAYEGSAARSALSAGPLAAAAFAGWCVLAMAATVDSFQNATRWFLDGLATRSRNPLVGFAPKSLLTSPIPVLAAALAVAASASASDLPLMFLMMPFATVLLGAGACLALEGLGGRPRFDATLCLFTGALSALAFVPGYVLPVPGLLWASAILALSPALPGLLAARGASASARPAGEAIAAAAEVPPPAAPTNPANDHGPSYAIADRWFSIRLIPTYDDTNSVGNVYFANYFRWVGKARETFFAHCMPDFDLKTTPFLILTKSFEHEFRRETSEFDDIWVRVRISAANRKFVTLEHRIESARHGLLGYGEQTLMFVSNDGAQKLVDLPSEVVSGFIAFFPEGPSRASAA